MPDFTGKSSSPGRGAAFFVPLRSAGTVTDAAFVTAPDQQRTTPQARRAAQHPGNAVPYLVYTDAAWTAAQPELVELYHPSRLAKDGSHFQR